MFNRYPGSAAQSANKRNRPDSTLKSIFMMRQKEEDEPEQPYHNDKSRDQEMLSDCGDRNIFVDIQDVDIPENASVNHHQEYPFGKTAIVQGLLTNHHCVKKFITQKNSAGPLIKSESHVMVMDRQNKFNRAGMPLNVFQVQNPQN